MNSLNNILTDREQAESVQPAPYTPSNPDLSVLTPAGLLGQHQLAVAPSSLLPRPSRHFSKQSALGHALRSQHSTLPPLSIPSQDPSSSPSHTHSSGILRAPAMPQFQPAPITITPPLAGSPSESLTATQYSTLARFPFLYRCLYSDRTFAFSSRSVYYKLFGPSSILPSRQSTDPTDPTIGRLSRNHLRPPGNVGIIRRYIASLEGFDVTDVYEDALSDSPLADGVKLGTHDGAPGTSADLPLAINVDELLPSPLSLSSPDTPPLPVVSPTACSTWWGEPPSPGDELHLPAPAHDPRMVCRGVSRSASATPSPENSSPPRGGTLPTRVHLPHSFAASSSSPAPSSLPRWTLDPQTGFAEPTLSPRRVDRVITAHQPPGWFAGRVQMIGKGLFMGKVGSTKGKGKGDAGELTSGTIVRNGMRVWVDMRVMRVLTLKSGDNCEFYVCMI